MPDALKPRQRDAVVAEFVDELRKAGSWCGETHVQKAAYVVEALFPNVRLNFGHILYKYGPYSAQLSDELVGLRADGLLDTELIPGYGPRLKTTPEVQRQLYARWPKTIRRHQRPIKFVAKKFDAMGVSELERLATAVWVRRELPHASAQTQAVRLHGIKPHVSLERAEEALSRVALWEEEAHQLPDVG